MEALTSLLNFLALIPGTFWGVVVGSFFSIGGVMLTNRANQRRLVAQFAHERQLRVSEREHALRKEVYLAATEAIAASISSIGRYVNLDVSYEDLSKTIAERMPTVAKVHVIGSQEVVSGLINVASKLSSVVQRLSVDRIPLIATKQQIDLLDAQLARSNVERDKLLEFMRNFNRNNETDKHRWDVLNGEFQFEGNRIAEALKRRAELQTQLVEGQLKYARYCIVSIHELAPVFVPAVVALRKELGLPIDEAAYLKVIQESLERQMEAFDTTLSDARKLHIGQTSAA